jgi:phosphoadenylyl-sulfate reductase (thioredoxin)
MATHAEGAKKGYTLAELIEHSKSLIRDGVNKYEKIAVAVSWGKDSMVVLHMALDIKPDIQCFTVLTPKMPKETFEYKSRMKELWNLNLKEYMCTVAIDDDLPLKNPDECCNLLKVMPTLDAIKELDCWITGLRMQEGATRSDFEEVEYYENIVKLNPILLWSEREVWQYLAVNNIPTHPYYKLGYRSLGCEPCTKIITNIEPERAGRWAGTPKRGGECGIHTMMKRKYEIEST